MKVPPPPGFRLPRLPIISAHIGGDTRDPLRGVTAAQKLGARYESKVHVELEKQFKHRYEKAPLLSYIDQIGGAACIPDAILRNPGRILAIEVKSQHMAESHWQLRGRYEPILRWIFPEQSILLLEICRSLDAAAPYPESYTSVEDISQFVESGKDGELGVLQWKI